MSELRYNPLLRDWTMVASHRQKRPNLPQNYCPFCPGSGKVPEAYDVYAYDNDFPALSPTPPTPDPVATGLYSVEEAYGKCEIVLYSSDHNAALPTLSVDHVRKLIDLWAERFQALSQDKRHQYIFIFENRGAEVGATMPHPHGQIYAYPFIPLKIRTELDSCSHHHAETGRCLICDINREEHDFAKRVVVDSTHFVAYIPFFTDYPYGVFIASKQHKTAITQFTDAERNDLAFVLKTVTAAMDALFDRDFPYMMALHQTPVNGPDVSGYYHFHIEFYPPLRDRDKIKFLASSETGAWAACNPTAVEQTAQQFRDAVARVTRSGEA